jgi:CHAT domain-containing protein/Tfp pilus assembly protein PilF
MRQVVGWMVVMFLCCAAGGQTGEGRPDARLVEAQTNFDAAKKLLTSGQYAESLLRARQALALREAVLGSTHPDCASCLDLMGNLYRLQGDVPPAEPLLQRALALREAALGHDHPDVASSLNSLANLYSTQGLYDRARPLYQRALALREAALGNDHPDVAVSIHNLANLYADQGLYDQAQPLYQRALTIEEAALGKGHPAVADSLTNLANLYADQGLNDQAEPLYLRAMHIYETALGENHPSVANPLTNLGILYCAQGFYARAEPLYLRALRIQETTLGKKHPRIAGLLNNLASLHWAQGSYTRAKPLLQRALAISESAFGKSHPDVASTLDNLAAIYSDRGLYHLSEPLFQRALLIREAVFGKNHPDVAFSLNNLATLYWVRGQYGRAEPLFQRALAIRQANFGKSHPDVAVSLGDLARLRLAQHRLADALPLFTRAFSIAEHRLRSEALDFSESRLSNLLHYLRKDEETLYALLRAHPKDARVQRLVLGAVLLSKGRSVEAMANMSRTLDQSLDTDGRDTLEQLRGLRAQLATRSLEGPGSLPLKDYQQQLHTLTQNGDALEEALARRSAPMLALQKLPPLEEIVDRVAASLPQDGALVEFIVYADSALVPHPGTPDKKKAAKAPRYLALVLLPNASIHAVDLGPADAIDSAASRLRDALANSAPSVETTAQRLEHLAFEPLRPLLGGIHRLILSPDGQLNLVPFDAFHDGQDFLLGAFDFTYLTSGRELLPRPQDRTPASSVIVLADPRFSASPTSEPFSGELDRSASSSRSDPTRSIYSPLPGTRLEAEGIQRLLPQAQLFLGAEATRERLMHLHSPGILHLATHGFFLGSAPSLTGSRGLFSPELANGPPPPQREPLLNSGLVLAGTPEPGFPDSHAEATLVTALELAGLDLWGTQLVVLSACDTGRGDVQPGQGVYGLRRALVVAGAESVVSSLWKVSDGSTPELINTYYRNLLAGQGRASALREAMRAFRAAHPRSHPHDWAAFIALGSDAPLHAMTPTGPRTSQP